MRLFALLLLTLVACGSVSTEDAYIPDECVFDRDCWAPMNCIDGHCTYPQPVEGCEQGTTRCNGDAVERCGDGGVRWERLVDCGGGCFDGACREPACTPNEAVCQGNDLAMCLANGSALVVVMHCPHSCVGDRCTFCIPGATRCVRDHLEAVCLEHGDEEALRDSCTDAGCRCP